MSENLIKGAAGMLEIILDYPKSQQSDTLVIIAHPHPVYGGSMHNKVVHTIARACNLSGLIALRFNFRGVGKSEGKFDNGIGEQADLAAVIKYATDKFPDKSLALAGFSFGAAICISQVAEDNYEFLLTVAPPIYASIANIKQIKPRWGLFMGKVDEVVAPEQVKAWLQIQENQPQQYWFDNAGHFFHGHLVDLRHKLVECIQMSVTG